MSAQMYMAYQNGESALKFLNGDCRPPVAPQLSRECIQSEQMA